MIKLPEMFTVNNCLLNAGRKHYGLQHHYRLHNRLDLSLGGLIGTRCCARLNAIALAQSQHRGRSGVRISCLIADRLPRRGYKSVCADTGRPAARFPQFQPMVFVTRHWLLRRCFPRGRHEFYGRKFGFHRGLGNCSTCALVRRTEPGRLRRNKSKICRLSIGAASLPGSCLSALRIFPRRCGSLRRSVTRASLLGAGCRGDQPSLLFRLPWFLSFATRNSIENL